MRFKKLYIPIAIIYLAVVGVLYLWVFGKLENAFADSSKKYQTAIEIKEKEIFDYALATDAGYAFVEVLLKAVKPVKSEEIPGVYIELRCDTEMYREHTKTYTDNEGHTKTRTYYSWDLIESDKWKAKEVKIMGHIFETEKIKLPGRRYIDTVHDGFHIRRKYYGLEDDKKGTLFTKLKDKTISKDSEFYGDETVSKAKKTAIARKEIILVVLKVVWWIVFGSIPVIIFIKE